jgi:hypothetical protein
MVIQDTPVQYDQRHGGPWDRGSADNYYGRAFEPHYFLGDTYSSERIGRSQMTPDQLDAYSAGWEYNARWGDRKDWG